MNFVLNLTCYKWIRRESNINLYDSIFLICLKISIMDDRMKPFMLITEFMKALGQQLEIWLEKIK